MSSSSSPPTRKRPRRKAALAATEKRTTTYSSSEQALARLKQGQRGVVFSGAGLSVSAGLSTFQSLYDQAGKQYGLDKGLQAFHYRFLQKSPKDCFEFLEQQFRRVRKVKSPTPAHRALQQMGERGQLIRHYTMNIDGLATTGEKVVELHGSLWQMVCRGCGEVMDSLDILEKNKKMTTAEVPPKCPYCKEVELRFRVLLYEDQEGPLISPAPNPLETTLEQDLLDCQWIVWVGVSFRQSASCEHFQKMLQAMQPSASIPIYIVSPEAGDAVELLQTAVGNVEGIHPVPMTSDNFFGTILPSSS